MFRNVRSANAGLSMPRRTVQFLEKWGGSLVVQAKMAATNKYLARSNKSRAVGKSTKNIETRLC
jgi:hypothetical protein